MSLSHPEIPESEDIPPCHALGPEPEGYDATQRTCWSCTDKFTCLAAAVEKPSRIPPAERKDRTFSLEDDFEVASVFAAEMPYKDAINRMLRRERLLEVGKVVPAELLVSRQRTRVVEVVETAAEVEEKKEAKVKSKSKKKGKSEAKRPTVPPKPARAPEKAAKPKVEAKPKAKAAKKKPVRAAKPRASNGHYRPVPRTLSPESLEKALRRIKLGKKVDLEVGFKIVRKSPRGDEHAVTIRKDGFELSTDKEVYSSLSAAAMVATGQQRSGNDFYNLVTNRCTTVLDQRGKVVATYTSADD